MTVYSTENIHHVHHVRAVCACREGVDWIKIGFHASPTNDWATRDATIFHDDPAYLKRLAAAIEAARPIDGDHDGARERIKKFVQILGGFSGEIDEAQYDEAKREDTAPLPEDTA